MKGNAGAANVPRARLAADAGGKVGTNPSFILADGAACQKRYLYASAQ
jgi:hypothetical protein